MNREYKKGLVSIALPVYNAGVPEKLPRAIESLLAQTYKNFELIISDNASTDNTKNICEMFATRDSRVRYIRQEKNLMQAPNTAFVIKEANGEYFMLAADDDYWHPDFIEKLKDVLDKNLQYGVAMGSIKRVYPDGETHGIVSYTGDLDLTHMDYAEVFDRMATKRPVHLYYYGLIRTPLIHAMLKRQFSKSKAYDRVFMMEMSLATHFYSLAEVLFDKTVYRTSAATRYAGEAIGASFRDPHAQSKFVWAAIVRVVGSGVIPFWRKVSICPYHLSAFVWRNRVFFREWFPRMFSLSLAFKGWLRRI
jgi:glycosyltransferase involved in cell wall biosynthesis